MASPKAEFVSTKNVPIQGPYEPAAQALRDLAEKTSPKDQRTLLAALDALGRSDTRVSVHVPTNWKKPIRRIRHIPPERHEERMRCISAIRDALTVHCEAAPSSVPESPFDTLPGQMLSALVSTLPPQSQALLAQTSHAMRATVNAQRAQLIASFRNEPGLERLLSYFCPKTLDDDQLGAFEPMRYDLLTKVVPDVLDVLESSTNLSDDEKKLFCTHSPEVIVGDASLLRRVLQAAYNNSLVSLIAEGGRPAPWAVHTLEEKARITREWLRGKGPSIDAFCLTKKPCMTCLPEEICLFTRLSSLDFTNQRIHCVPHCIGNLRGLQTLNLGGNLLSILPPEIGNLSSLQTLNLGDNLLSILPSEIGNLSGLQTLDLHGNQLAFLPSEIGKLSDLQTLRLHGNQLAFLPSEIGKLSDLNGLDLRFNLLSALPSEIGNITSLAQLSLRHNRFSAFPLAIGNIKYLQILDLSGNQLISLPPEIGTFRYLTQLFLGYNRLTTLPPKIGKLTNLSSLFLHNNQITSLPQEIESLFALSRLSLDGNPLTDLSLRRLRNLKETRYSLDVSLGPPIKN